MDEKTLKKNLKRDLEWFVMNDKSAWFSSVDAKELLESINALEETIRKMERENNE